MRNNQYQILFEISYKTFIFKDIDFLFTVGWFLVKNDVIFPLKNFEPLPNLIFMTYR